ncbi:alpha/beta fold hydrolase [Actinokineospora bangkokensis]|uniref:Alpha/beta hydrolase n=1 Tax=Actinokineospora bangkokensis TaxID=1193682 RepID=A0A1Q9LDQ6_9PSEU|nr:alpha/beta hydrolase [Actinokineospora bangkokensis]OLR90146.1 alpha/beta hydrolase [Actinokineospora bangkokensis]
MHSQVTPHHAEPVVLAGRFGPVSALRAAGPGPIALLVPGYTGSKEDFAPLLDPIAAAGYEVLAIDLPGQLGSAGPEDERGYLPGPLGGFLAELVGKLAADGRPVLLTGHSYGGVVARHAVLAGAPVAGLTLVSSGPSALPEGPRRFLLDAGEPLLRDKGVAEVQKLLDQLNSATPRWRAMSPEQRAFLRERFLRNRAEALLGMGRGLRDEPDLVDETARALGGVPSLVVFGDADDAWPPATQELMGQRLGARVVTIPGAAHSPALEKRDDLLDVLLSTWQEWLGRPPG